MTTQQINEMLPKLDAARAIFDMGQRSLPFLEEVVVFLREISPLLDQINSSIQESTSTMPRATTQLESVSQATEMATTEILDLVDAATARLGEISACSEQGIRREQALLHADERLMETLRAGLSGKDDELLATVERLHADREKIRTRHLELSPSVTNTVAALRSMLCRITTSLQVQDITSQQIAAVNHLIESMRRRMDALVQDLNTEGSRLKPDSRDAVTGAAFDPDARYDRSPDDQAIADAVFGGDGAQQGIKPGSPQVELDLPVETVFNSDTANPLSSPQDQAKGDMATQDEIDRLFGGA